MHSGIIFSLKIKLHCFQDNGRARRASPYVKKARVRQINTMHFLLYVRVEVGLMEGGRDKTQKVKDGTKNIL